MKEFLHHHRSLNHLLSRKQLSASTRTAVRRQTASGSLLIIVRDGHISFSSCCTDVRVNVHHGLPLKNAPRCMIKEDKWLQRAVLSQLNSKRRLSEIILSKTASICAALHNPPFPLSLTLSLLLCFSLVQVFVPSVNLLRTARTEAKCFRCSKTPGSRILPLHFLKQSNMTRLLRWHISAQIVNDALGEENSADNFVLSVHRECTTDTQIGWHMGQHFCPPGLHWHTRSVPLPNGKSCSLSQRTGGQSALKN